MKDREFLKWVHDRLHYRNGDSTSCDFMHRLRAIIAATPEGQNTPLWPPCCGVVDTRTTEDFNRSIEASKKRLEAEYPEPWDSELAKSTS